MAPSVPVVERADHADPPGIGRPDREGDAIHAFHGHRARTEPFVDLEMLALCQEVHVHLAQDWRKAVRIFDLPASSGAAQPQPIGKAVAATLDSSGEETGLVQSPQRGDFLPARRVDDRDMQGARLEDAHDEAALRPFLVHAEIGERVGVITGNDGTDGHFLLQARHGRSIPPWPTSAKRHAAESEARSGDWPPRNRSRKAPSRG